MEIGARHRAPGGSDCSFEMESGAPLPKQSRTSLTMLKNCAQINHQPIACVMLSDIA